RRRASTRIASRVDSACSVVPTLGGYATALADRREWDGHYRRRMPVLSATRVVTPDGVIGPAAVEVEDGHIIRVGPTGGRVPDRVLVPGLVDLQVNGIDDVDVASAEGADWDALDQHLLAQGVTTWCPTLVTAPL